MQIGKFVPINYRRSKTELVVNKGKENDDQSVLRAKPKLLISCSGFEWMKSQKAGKIQNRNFR